MNTYLKNPKFYKKIYIYFRKNNINLKKEFGDIEI